VRRNRRMLQQRRLHQRTCEHRRRVRHREHLQLSVRHGIQDVRVRVHRQYRLLHQQRLHAGPGEYQCHLYRRQMHLPVLERITPVWHRVRPQHGSRELRSDIVHGMPTIRQWHRHLQRHDLRPHVQLRFHELQRHLRKPTNRHQPLRKLHRRALRGNLSVGRVLHRRQDELWRDMRGPDERRSALWWMQRKRSRLHDGFSRSGVALPQCPVPTGGRVLVQLRLRLLQWVVQSPLLGRRQGWLSDSRSYQNGSFLRIVVAQSRLH
jgi:hypothetical protein